MIKPSIVEPSLQRVNLRQAGMYVSLSGFTPITDVNPGSSTPSGSAATPKGPTHGLSKVQEHPPARNLRVRARSNRN